MQILLYLIFITYFLPGFSLLNFSGYGITPLDIVTLIFYFYILKKVLWDGIELKFTLNPALLALIALFAAALLSSFNPLTSGAPKMILQYLKTSIHFFYLVGFSFIACVYPIDAKKWTNVIKLWLILAFIINIFGIYQIVARAYELPLAWIQFNNVSLAGRDGVMDEAGVNQLSLRYGDFFRATSIFSEPSALGAFNIFILSFLVLPIIQKRVAFFKSRFVIIIFIIASIACLLLTFSMTGAIGFFMLFASVVVFEKFMRLKTIIKTSIVVILIVIIADTSVSTYTHLSVIELFQRRITGLMNYGTRDVEKDVTPGESAYSRITSGTNSVKIWQDYPITGIGLGLTSSNKKYEIGFSDFSVLAALAEMGLIGFISFNVMFLALFVICLRFIRTRAKSNNFSNDQQRMMGIIFYIMLVEFLINFISGNNIIGIGLWIPVAIVFSTVNNFYIGTSDNVRTISLVKVPLKYTFAKNLAKYYESKNDKT